MRSLIHYLSISVQLALAMGSSISIRHNSRIARTITRTLAISLPTNAPVGRQVIDASFQGYSIEFSYMLDYGGNLSYPNELSIKLLQNLFDISGAHPIIRAGGSTQNRCLYKSNQTVALIQRFSASSPDQPAALTIGPAWLESFQTFPKGTKYIYGLNFYDGDVGIQETLDEAIPAYAALGDSIYAFEIGNEVDGWPGGSRRPANWTVQSYVDQWKIYANAVSTYAIGSADSRVEPLFQAGAFEAPRHLGNTSYWNAESVLRDGIASTGKVKSISEHDYMGSYCNAPKSTATIANNLLDHSHMTSLMWYHDYLSNYTVSQNSTYVIGETNSIGCQGQPGISDVFAAALWSIDYVLYVATLHVSRIYFHMGTPYRYSAWQPIDITNSTTQVTTLAHVKPLYYGNMFTSTALAGGNKQVAILVNETSLTAYGIYDAGSTIVDRLGRVISREGKLESVVIVNLAMWNSTQTGERPTAEVQLAQFGMGNSGGAYVRRLTSPGVEIAENITWAGQYIAGNGSIVGKQVVEKLGSGGSVLVGASEAVLITF